MSELHRLLEVVDPVGGVVPRVYRAPVVAGGLEVPVFAAPLGRLDALFASVEDSVAGGANPNGADGASCGFDVERTRLLAVAEALERYASMVYSDEQLIWASASELGAAALDLDLGLDRDC